MREKLSLFNELHLTKKEEILFELKEYSDSLKEEDGYSAQNIKSLKHFISKFSKEIKKHKLPELNNWWQYRYIITGHGAELDMCYCSSIEYSDDGEDILEESEGESFTLFKIPVDYISTQSYFKKYNIPSSDIEDLIRNGRIQHVKYDNDQWYISDLQDRPSETFSLMMFTLPLDRNSSFFKQNPSLKGFTHVDILPTKSNNAFSVIFRMGDGKKTISTMSGDEVGSFVLLLLKSPSVSLHSISDTLYRPFPKEYDVNNNRTIDRVIQSFRKKEEGLHYGSVIVTKGVHKGQIGIYDDDDLNRCIVYFGDLSLTNTYYHIPRSSLSNNISSEQIQNRFEQLYRHLFDAYGSELDYESLLELFYCYSLFNHRFINAIYKSPVGDSPMVFISHATEDIKFAEMIAIDLKDCGYDFFLDAYSIILGASIPRRISEGLKQSCALIILVSDSYNSSVFCNDEWESFYLKYSREKPNSIIPIMIGKAEPPTLLSAKKYERFTGNNYNVIIESIKTTLHIILQEQNKLREKRSI